MAYADRIDDPEGPAAIRENFSRILEGSASAEYAYNARMPRFQGAPTTRFGDTGPPTPPMSQQEIPTPPMSQQEIPMQGYGAAAYYYDTAAQLGYKSGLGSLNFFEMFPSLFTFTSLLVFLPPIWTTIHLAEDPSVARWIGPWCQIAILLPFIFAFAHVVHRRTGMPNKSVVMIALLVPSITLLALNDAVTSLAHDKGTQLFSTDCDVVYSKRELERSWLEAYRVYQRCLTETVPRRTNLTMAKAQELFRIQDCEEYKTLKTKYDTDWTYLESVENDHYCGGWCSLQRPLWTRKEVTDSCSIAVASVFKTKVGRFSQQVVIYMIVVLICASAGLIMAGPKLRKWGVDW